MGINLMKLLILSSVILTWVSKIFANKIHTENKYKKFTIAASNGRNTLLESIISGKKTEVKTQMKFEDVRYNNQKIEKKEDISEINFIESYNDNKKDKDMPKISSSPIGRVEKEKTEMKFEIPEIIKHSKAEEKKLQNSHQDFLGNLHLMNNADMNSMEDNLLKRFADGLRIGLNGKNENLTIHKFAKVPLVKKEPEQEQSRINTNKPVIDYTKFNRVPQLK